MILRKLILKKIKTKLKKNRIRQKARLKEERNIFTTILNHDIKTPLIAQMRSLELVLKGQFGKLDDENKEILSEVFNSNCFLLEIITNAIFLADFENEQPKPVVENIDFFEEIKDCCNVVKNFAQEKSQNIILKPIKSKNINLQADRRFIQKILYNILAGSISFGFEKSDIEIFIKENKETISFYAKNKSVYMTKEKLESLFEDKKNMTDFNQLGMSLNLNIAKKLIMAHNWSIIAESKKDNSLSFGFVVKKQQPLIASKAK